MNTLRLRDTLASRYVIAPAIGATVLVTTACGPNNDTPTAASSSVSAEKSSASSPSAESPNYRKMTLVPNMSGFLRVGTSDTCLNGAPHSRPCGLKLRVRPTLSSDPVTADPADAQPHVSWPVEAYGSDPGSEVTVDCYKDVPGKDSKVTTVDGSISSNIWFQVEVPAEAQYVRNKSILAELGNAATSTIVPIIHNGNQVYVEAWGAAPWFGRKDAPAGLERCQ